MYGSYAKDKNQDGTIPNKLWKSFPGKVSLASMFFSTHVITNFQNKRPRADSVGGRHSMSFILQTEEKKQLLLCFAEADFAGTRKCAIHPYWLADKCMFLGCKKAGFPKTCFLVFQAFLATREKRKQNGIRMPKPFSIYAYPEQLDTMKAFANNIETHDWPSPTSSGCPGLRCAWTSHHFRMAKLNAFWSPLSTSKMVSQSIIIMLYLCCQLTFFIGKLGRGAACSVLRAACGRRPT
jgi:hypothetical protein